MNARDPLTTEEAAARWRRAVRACLPGETPETAVECCSHLALRDAEAQIAQLLASLRALVERHTEI